MKFRDGWFLQGDCLEVMKKLPAGSVDMVLCDLPYGTTQNKWDTVIPFDSLWTAYWSACKLSAAVVLTATQPFSSALGASQINSLRYSWAWRKQHTGQLNAKRMPLKNIEDVLVFYREQPAYNPQYGGGKAYTLKRKGYKGNDSYGAQKDHSTESDGRRYPMQLIDIATRDKDAWHPTQKPVALFEYLIRTYTNPGDVVLDNTAGSGTTAIAAIRAGRRFVCIEQDEKYYAAACERVRAEEERSDNGQA